MRILINFFVAAISILFTLSSADAQIIFGQRGHLASNFVYQGWKVSDDEQQSKIHEYMTLIQIFVPIADNVELKILSSAASADLTVGFSPKRELTGTNDTRIQASYAFGDDAFLLTLGINLPTGTKALDPEELEVSNWLTDNSLEFPIRRYGEGLNLSCGVALAHELGPFILGLGGGYQYNGEYKPLKESEGRYKPGDEITGTIGIDQRTGKTLFRGNFTYTHFFDDQYGGEVIFKKGDMFEIEGIIRYSGEKTQFEINGRGILRQKDYLLNGGNHLVVESRNSHGDDFRIFSGLRYLLRKSFAIKGLTEVKMVSANEYQEDKILFENSSMFAGLGGGFDINLSNHLSLALSSMYFFGKVDGENKDLEGLDLVGTLKITF